MLPEQVLMSSGQVTGVTGLPVKNVVIEQAESKPIHRKGRLGSLCPYPMGSAVYPAGMGEPERAESYAGYGWNLQSHSGVLPGKAPHK